MIKRLIILIAFTIIVISGSVFSQRLPQLGIASSMENDSVLYQSGFRLIGESVGNLLSPKLSNEQFLEKAQYLKPLSVRSICVTVFFLES